MGRGFDDKSVEVEGLGQDTVGHLTINRVSGKFRQAGTWLVLCPLTQSSRAIECLEYFYVCTGESEQLWVSLCSTQISEFASTVKS